MSYRVIFFNLDGILTDPTKGITRSVQYVLAQLGVPAPDRGRLRPFIGPPLHQCFTQRYGFDEGQAWRAIEVYRGYFARRGMYENLLFPGVPELLAGLRTMGRTLYVATSKPTHFAVRIVAHFGLTRFFARVLGSEFDRTNADEPTLMRRARALHPDEPDGAFVMIGDREHDIIGARANGLASIGVTYGAGETAEIAHSVAELAALLR